MANIPAYGLTGANQALGQYGVPAYGLAGANQALGTNINARLSPVNGSAIDYNRDLAMQQGQTGINALQGYSQPGLQAQQQQAAMSGALGPQAQQQAYASFQSSPGQQWLQEQAERGLLRNSAAIGGLGGGNVRQALQAQAMGMAQQDWQNQFNNIGAVGDRGLQAAGLQNNLYNMMGGAATSAGAQHAGLQSAQIGAGASLGAAQIAARTALARDRANYAYQAGQDIANNYGGTTSALANLVNQQGAGMSDMFGNYTGNISNLLAGAGGQQAQSNANLAALLANIATGTSSNVAGLPGIPGTQQSSGILNSIGQFLGGVNAAARPAR